MSGSKSGYGLFLREFRRTFHTTGAVLPSGRALATALAGLVDRGKPQRVLEVGPGTGAVTAQIVARLGPDSMLDLVELNDQFVAHLEQRFASEPAFQQVADRSRVLHQSIECLDPTRPYDVVISGLPLNNFSVTEVAQILGGLVSQLRPGGTLSFFEYIAIRNAKAVVSGRKQRERLQGISRLLDDLFRQHPSRRQWIWPNVPPAWVHHVTVG